MTTKFDALAAVASMTPEEQTRIYTRLARERAYNLSFTVPVRTVTEARWVFEEIFDGATHYNDARLDDLLTLVEAAIDEGGVVRVGREHSSVIYIKPPNPYRGDKLNRWFERFAEMAKSFRCSEIGAYTSRKPTHLYDWTDDRPGWHLTESERKFRKEARAGSARPDLYGEDGEDFTFMSELRLWWD